MNSRSGGFPAHTLVNSAMIENHRSDSCTFKGMRWVLLFKQDSKTAIQLLLKA